MKKSVNAWCFPEDLPLLDALHQAKVAGFDAIELNVVKDGDPNTIGGALRLDMTDEELRAVKETVNAFLPISGISTALFWKHAYTSDDAETRELSKSITRRMIDIAKALDVGAILVVPGLVTSDIAYDIAYERAFSALAELAPYAESAGVVIGVENVWNKFLLSPLEARDFIDKINSPFVKFYFDAGNVLLFGHSHHWVKILGDRIIRVHVKDFRTDRFAFVNLLHGDLDFPKLVSALRDVGYDGYLTAELDPYKHAPQQLIIDTAIALDKILDF